MSNNTQMNEAEGTFVLPRSLEISEIKNVYEEVSGLMTKTYEKFVIDAGQVALIDTAGVQFLVQMIRILKAQGCKIEWVNDSIQVYQMAAELGLEDAIDE